MDSDPFGAAAPADEAAAPEEPAMDSDPFGAAAPADDAPAPAADENPFADEEADEEEAGAEAPNPFAN